MKSINVIMKYLFCFLLSIALVLQLDAQGKDTHLAKGKRSEIFKWIYEVDSIGKTAYQYRIQMASNSGGHETYLGFKIPTYLESTGYGKYTLYDVQEDEIVIQAKPTKGSIAYIVIIDSKGKRKEAEFRQRGSSGEEFVNNNNAIVADMYKIVKVALDWRRTHQTSDGDSFESFLIPLSLSSSANGSYSLVEVKKDTIYVLAVSSIGSGSEYFRIDCTGKLKCMVEGTYRPPKQ